MVTRVFTTWVTALERIDHAVTDEACAARTVENRGAFSAVCGAVFLPGPMEAPPASLCPRCVVFLRGRTQA